MNNLKFPWLAFLKRIADTVQLTNKHLFTTQPEKATAGIPVRTIYLSGLRFPNTNVQQFRDKFS